MGKYLPDPDIDRLVQETNLLAEGDGYAAVTGHEPPAGGLDDVRLSMVESGERLAGLFRGMDAPAR